MRRTFGTVEVDTTMPGQGTGPYLFFSCSATGRNGEVWGELAARVEAELFRLDELESQALLRAAGNMLGGDVGPSMLAQLEALAANKQRRAATRRPRPQ